MVDVMNHNNSKQPTTHDPKKIIQSHYWSQIFKQKLNETSLLTLIKPWFGALNKWNKQTNGSHGVFLIS